MVPDDMKVLGSFEALGTAQPATRRQMPEDQNPQIHCRENLKSLHNPLGHLSGFKQLDMSLRYDMSITRAFRCPFQ